MAVLKKIREFGKRNRIDLRLQASYKSGPALSARGVSVKCTRKVLPTVGKFLKHQKSCLAEYVGTEQSRNRGKTSLRADVFAVSNDGENPHKNRP